MKKVLLRILFLTLAALFIAAITYISIKKSFGKEVIILISALALSSAIPIIIGYIFANISLRSASPILTVVKLILFLINGLLIIGATMLTIGFCFEEKIVFISIPFLLAGAYTYYETIQLIRQPPSAKVQAFSEDAILDDFL
jgi:hypothetical protein